MFGTPGIIVVQDGSNLQVFPLNYENAQIYPQGSEVRWYASEFGIPKDNDNHQTPKEVGWKGHRGSRTNRKMVKAEAANGRRFKKSEETVYHGLGYQKTGGGSLAVLDACVLVDAFCEDTIYRSSRSLMHLVLGGSVCGVVNPVSLGICRTAIVAEGGSGVEFDGFCNDLTDIVTIKVRLNPKAAIVCGRLEQIDPEDKYPFLLAAYFNAPLVTVDRHLIGVRESSPVKILSPWEFLREY